MIGDDAVVLVDDEADIGGSGGHYAKTIIITSNKSSRILLSSVWRQAKRHNYV